jgi:hypothetical protein
MTNHYPRETVEFQPVVVTVDTVEVVTAVELCILPTGDRPVELDWQAAVELENRIGLMIDGLDHGSYHVWARITDTPEIPVLDCGALRIT